MVDGCQEAYRYNSVEQYLKAGVLIKGACQKLVSSQNRAKYRKQVQVGFGVFLDAYSPDSEHYVDGLDVERLRANVATALRVADEYVWIYGEQFRWWNTLSRRVSLETWPEAVPGCEQALRYVRDPVGYAQETILELKESGEFINLALNGDFSEEQDGLPIGWNTWQRDTSEGTFSWDHVGATSYGSARMEGVTDGCFHQQQRPVLPGQCYAIRAVRRIEGNGVALIRIRWKTTDNRRTEEALDRLIFCHGPRDEWSEFFGVVEVPDSVGRLVMLLSVIDQRSSTDVVYFDDVELSQLP
jgi:hypothetical protein